VDRSALTSPLCWVARRWLQFLVGLAILVVAFGVSGPAEAAITPAAQPAVVAVADSADTVQSADAVQAEPEFVLSGRVRSRVLRQRPASVAEPVTAYAAAVGPRAPPASGALPL
jgi:hypothetical protein